MKKIFFVVTILLALNSGIFSQQIVNKIEVSGTAISYVVPDKMQWNIEVKADNDVLSVAKERAENSTNKILTVLKKYNVEDKNIQTAGLSVQKNIKYNYEDIKEFTATNQVVVTLYNTELYQKILDEVILFPGIYVKSPVLQYSKEIEARKQARRDTLIAAKEKATMMAEVYGMTIGNPIDIIEEAIYFYSNITNSFSYTDETGDTYETFMPGTIQISAKVRVVFVMK